jgi:hypothetical protein
LLGADEAERLRKQSIGTGIVSALIGGLAAAPNYRYTGIAPILGQALQSGFQGMQGTYTSALENYQTQQKMLEAQRQQEQQRLRNEAITSLSPEEQALARIDPNSLGTLMAAKLKPTKAQARVLDSEEKAGLGLPIAAPYQMDAEGKISLIQEPTSTQTKLSPNESIAARYMFKGNDNPDTWTLEQTNTWLAYINAPSVAEQARIADSAKNTQFATGGAGLVPASRADILRGQGVPTTRQPSAPQPTTAQPTAAQPTAPSESAFSQVSPKQREQLILERPRAEQALGSVVGKTEDLNEVVTSLLANKEGLARSTGISSKVPSIPGSPAYQAQSDLVNIKTRLATRALQEMRDLSKTGGAVGQVTEREWPRLEQEFANLDAAQNMKAVESSLKKIQGILQRWRTSAEKSFVQTYGTAEQVSQTPISPQGRQMLTPEQQNAFQKYIGR